MIQVKSYSLSDLATYLCIDKGKARFIKNLTLCNSMEEYCDLEEVINKALDMDIDFGQFQYSNLLSSILQCIDAVLDTHGVEYIGQPQDGYNWCPDFDYCNTGDMYTFTVALQYSNQCFYLTDCETMVIKSEGLKND